MNNGNEKRRHPRVPLWWPVFLSSSSGLLLGTIKNISVKGALVYFLEPIKNEDEFQITIQSSEENEIPITCKKVWSGLKSVGNVEHNSIGLLFTKISFSDQNFIDALVAES